MGIFELGISTLINASAYMYIWIRLMKGKIDFKKTKNYVYFIMLLIIMMLNYMYIDNKIRIVLISCIFALFSHIITKESLIKSTLAVIFSQGMIIIGETITALVVLNIMKIDLNEAIQNLFGTIIINTIISLIAILILQLKFVRKSFDSVLTKIDNGKPTSFMRVMLILMISMNLIFITSYYKVETTYLLLLNVALFAIYAYIIFKILEEKNNILKINEKYTTTLSSLNEYEEILDKYRISNHENKNQLLVIRNMIVSKEKDIPKYIDELIENKLKDNEKLMFELNVIPPGGIRAIIYSKMLVMEDKKIKGTIKVSRSVRTMNIISMNDELKLEICKIVGVYLDNAIEAAENLKKPTVFIELHMEADSFCVEISNNFEGNIEVDKLTNIGYTTKENGHGYGLPLVKEIISKNTRLEDETSISGNVFTQKLIVKNAK